MIKEPSKRLDPTITAALIGVAGTIIVALITVYGNRLPAPQPTPVLPTAVVYTDTAVAPTAVPTNTVPIGDPTLTPALPTFTPEPLPTATLIPAGADWLQNCISAVWTPYPTSADAESDDKGCLIQPADTFYTNPDGELGFVFNDRVTGAQVYGLFTKLPPAGTVGLDVHLSQLIKGEVLVGIFEAPEINSKGALLVMPAGKGLDEQIMQLKKMPDINKLFSRSPEPVASASATYDVLFDYDSGNVTVSVKSNQYKLGTVPVVSAEKWLFVGYQVLNGTNELQADFSNLVITS